MTNLSNQTRQRILLLITAMIAITVASAFAIVWMQQQINRTARSSVVLENELAELVDDLRYLDEKISKFHQPVYLQSKVGSHLRPATEQQVAWVAEREMPTGHAYVHADPFEVSIDLAMMDLNSQR